MYTTHSKPYPDLIRVWHKRTLQGLPRSAPESSKDASTRKTITASNSNSNGISARTSNRQRGLHCKEKSDHASNTHNYNSDDNDGWYDDDDDDENDDEFPSYVDPTVEQELCIDPIRALAIPRSRYRKITELTLCCKGITRLHPNVQLLENLDTLVIRHNRLRQIDFLLPTSATQQNPLTSTTQNTNCNTTNTAAATTTSINSSAYNIRGCRLLRCLYASHNCLQTLDGDVSRLRQLEVLMLAHNRLGNLRAVSAHLKPLRWLRELDLRGNPLCDEVGYRLFLIHEHPNIEVLDRRAVRPEERKEAAELYRSHKSKSPQRTAVNTMAIFSTSAQTAGERMGQATPLRRGHGGKTDEVEVEEGEKRGGHNALTPRSVTFPLLTQSQQQQSLGISTSPIAETKMETPRKTVAFLSTFTPPPETTETGTSHRMLFQPSACEVLLKKKIRLIEAKKLKKLQEDSEKEKQEQQEVQEKYKALHATWALSRQGMPLSSENWEESLKSLEVAPSGTSAASNEVPSNTLRRQSVRRKSHANRQQNAETATITTASTTAAAAAAKSNTAGTNPGLGIDIDEIQLPPVPPVVKGHVDYSVLYDALLGHSDIVNMRLGKKQDCLPNPSRLLRMDDVLNKTKELLLMPKEQEQLQEDGTLGGIRNTQVSLLRAIQQEKESFIPKPWEQIVLDGLTVTISVSEQLEYLYHMALAFFLPTELSALEGQFMTTATEAVVPQETQRAKRPTKKEKHRPSDTTAPTSVNTIPVSPTTSTLMQQKLPTVLTTTNVEVGPPERASFLRVMNMLDVESGAWNLNLDEMTEAFCSAYQSKACVSIVDTLGNGEDERGNTTTNRRGRRSIVKLRAKGERRHGERPQSNTGDARSNTSLVSMSAATAAQTTTAATTRATPPGTRSVTLMLNVVLLDLLRYVPFVESRLAFFRTKCAATASKAEGGATGEAAREWFTKSQLAATHLEKLLQALKRAGLKEEDAKIRLVPQESMIVRPLQEVGELFRERAHLLDPTSSLNRP
ncbi:hypothetical protein LSM04_000003 [Trypanosoma melophagium]|uniref:uncharacterized protein n=1 Tax=Trypanosoma melophagium TaxID=715481 RepID=UPI00351A5BDE|nr:hypothetical protein LSM04_000003 [Trypanosoma melophagium]